MKERDKDRSITREGTWYWTSGTIGGRQSIVLLRYVVSAPSRNQSHGSSDCPAAAPHHLILHAIIITDAKSIESHRTHLRHPRISPVFACYSWSLCWYSHQLTRSRHNSRAFSKHTMASRYFQLLDAKVEYIMRVHHENLYE